MESGPIGEKRKEMTVFLCEDRAIAKEIIDKYFDKGKVTYAGIFDAQSRSAVVEALEQYI